MEVDDNSRGPLMRTVNADWLDKLEDHARKYHLLHSVCLKHWPAYCDIFHAVIGMETDEEAEE